MGLQQPGRIWKYTQLASLPSSTRIHRSEAPGMLEEITKCSGLRQDCV